MHRKNREGKWNVPKPVKGAMRRCLFVDDFLGALGELEEGPNPLIGYAISSLVAVMGGCIAFIILGFAGILHAAPIAVGLVFPFIVLPGAALIMTHGFNRSHGRERRLMDAVWDCNSEKVETCLSEGANPNGCGLGVPLHEAASCGHERNIRLLLAAGADVNAADERGNTALLIAAREGKEKAVAVLCGHPGIRKDIRNADGQTACDFLHRVGEPAYPCGGCGCGADDFDAAASEVIMRPARPAPKSRPENPNLHA